MPDIYPAMELSVALAVGLLIGLERGWKERAGLAGSRVAGFRTIGLIGLLGGLAMLIDTGNGLVLAGGFIALALLLRQGFEARIDATRDLSATTMVAALAAFALGAVAVSGRPQLAAMGGVATTFILWLRVPFHSLLERLEAEELSALLHWLLITIIVLPLLPDQAFGPYQALNPRTIWLMIVVISGLSFVGYLGMKWLGRRRGSFVLAFFGALVSSTATTLAFAHLSRQDDTGDDMLLAGVATAWSIMFVRTFAVLAVFAPVLLAPIALPLLVMLAVCGLQAARLYWRNDGTDGHHISVSNPLDLWAAIVFAAILTAGMLGSKMAAGLFGDVGLYLVAVIAGAVDIEAISLSLTQLVDGDVAVRTAAIAVVLAAMSNTLFKGGLAATLGSGRFRGRCLRLAVVACTCGAAALSLRWLWPVLG